MTDRFDELGIKENVSWQLQQFMKLGIEDEDECSILSLIQFEAFMTGTKDSSKCQEEMPSSTKISCQSKGIPDV